MELIFSLEEIDGAAKKFLTLTDSKKIFTFNGEMGAGKTTFIQAVCRQMGVIEKMSSPTYPLINQYKTTSGAVIFHIDLFRLKNSEEAIQAGVEDCLNSGEYCFIEWPQIIMDILPLVTLPVFMQILDNRQRRLTVNFP